MKNLKSDIKKIDKFGIFDEYDNWAKHAKETIKIDPQVPENKDIDNILFLGLGGSATTGDIIQSWLEHKLKVNFAVSRDYRLPQYVNKNSLIIAASISGETNEVINASIEAKKRGAKVLTISSGGKLEKISKRMNIDHTKIKMKIVPRVSLLSILIPAIKILNNMDLIENPKKDFEAMINAIDKKKAKISYKSTIENNTAMKLAKKLEGTMPSIYSSYSLSPAGYRFKASLNENSKVRAIHVTLPELCHNEIQSWGIEKKDFPVPGGPVIPRPIFLLDSKQTKEEKNRFETLKFLLNKIDINPIEVKTTGTRYLEKIVGMIYELDYVSLYLSILRNIDPTPTPHIDEFKKILKKLD